MSLQDLTLEDEYRSDRGNIIQDFYIPCLEHTNVYQRAVGFFSSTSMAAAAKGLTALIRSGGKMQLIASPHLSKEDAQAIATGVRQREEIIETIISQELEQEFQQIIHDRLACLAWLLKQGVLEIKLAVARDIRQYGIYHEKLGIFTDHLENIVAFTGSANESSAALIDNFECIDVFCSWHSGVANRAKRKLENFQRLWNNNTQNIEIIEFPEAARRSLLKFCPYKMPIKERELLKKDYRSVSEEKGNYKLNVSTNTLLLKNPNEMLTIPNDIQLREHQRLAIKEWFASNGKGILEMATGSGKTITSLAAATFLYKHIGASLLIIIVCPYLHLVSQWIEEAKRFGLNPLPCAFNHTQWEQELSVRLYNLTTGMQSLSSIVTTNVTFASERFQHQLRKVSQPLLLIVDEVHNFGAEQLCNSLPQNDCYRLGLSATPERWFDVSGSQALTDYFGSTLAHYTIKEALQDGVLCPYRYYPQLIELTDNEFELYYELTVKIARAFTQNRKTVDEPPPNLKALLIQRARLIATAQQKLEALLLLLNPLQHSTHNLIYCGDGNIDSKDEESLTRQIDEVTRQVGNRLGMKVAKYTANTSLERRKELKEQFARGEIQCLVAIRCLDEGVDIPETKRAFILASSSNPRQFIQRRGRVLRISPGKQVAEIFDMIVKPPDDFTYPKSEYYTVTRSLFGKELGRVIEFAKLAINGPEALHDLLDLRDRLNLLDIG